MKRTVLLSLMFALMALVFPCGAMSSGSTVAVGQSNGGYDSNIQGVGQGVGMKPILITCDPALWSVIDRSATRLICNILAQMGIPYEILPAGSPATLDDDRWSAAVVPYAGNRASVRPWANGEKPYPVLIGTNDGGLTTATDTWKSGASARYPDNSWTGSPEFTKLTGEATIYVGGFTPDRWWAYTLDTTTAPVCVPVLTVAAADEQHAGWAAGDSVGKSVVWYRDWSTVAPSKSFVMWNVSHNSFYALLRFFKMADIKPPRPYRLCIDVDDITDLHRSDAPASAADGIAQFAVALAARNTVALLGWNNALIGSVPNSTITAVSEGYYSGVYRNIIHHHIAGITGENYFAEDTVPYDTVTKKIAAYDADIAEWQNLGLAIERSGYHGFKYMPKNQCSRLGRRAMASVGVKRVRWTPSPTYRPRTIGGTHEWLIDAGEPTMQIVWSNGQFSAIGWNRYSWAAIIEDVAITTGSEEEYLARCFGLFWSGIAQSAERGMYHMMTHGLNIAANSAAEPGDDMPLLTWMEKVFDPLVQLGGTDVIRYATDDDWREIAESPGYVSMNIGDARTLPNNTPVYIEDAIITAGELEPGVSFAGSPDRSSGVKLITDRALMVGQRVSFIGMLSRVDGEYQMADLEFLEMAPGTPIAPLLMNSTAIANDRTQTLNYAGLNTTGLLVRTAGVVTSQFADECFFYIDDGDGYRDGTSPYSTGIRVYVPFGVDVPEEGDQAIVTGISRVQKVTLNEGGDVNGNWYPPGTLVYIPSIWVRDADDIQVLQP